MLGVKARMGIMDGILEWAKRHCVHLSIEILLLEKGLTIIHEKRSKRRVDVTSEVLGERRTELAELNDLINTRGTRNAKRRK
jgi:hypothetical protein